MTTYRFKLYVSGSSVRSQMAISNLTRICERDFGADALIDVVDVVAEPDQAEEARILTTPTLVREEPEPQVRIIGDLADESAVRRALGLD